jgi:hypothetical protein
MVRGDLQEEVLAYPNLKGMRTTTDCENLNQDKPF